MKQITNMETIITFTEMKPEQIRGGFAACYIASTLEAPPVNQEKPVVHEPKPRVRRKYKK